MTEPLPEAGYVRLVEVSKHFGDFLAVDRVSLDVAQGEIFCLLGASGSGKTTLLRMLAGFEAPSSGRLMLDGQDLTLMPPYRRPLNMMFQSYALFPHMNVQRNVAFGLEQEHMGRDAIRRRVGEILEVVRMGDYRLRKPHQLSGGQRQRVALARALIKRPKLLLLDEPLAALDRKLREHTQFELLNIQQQLGVTFIVVTHDQQEAMTLATRIGVMNHGALVQVGSPREVYEQPATRFVADFIGSVNLLEAQLLEQRADGVLLQCAELPVPVLIERRMAPPGTATMWIALRPEQLVLSSVAPRQPHNWAQGVVSDIAYRGDSSVVVVRLSSGRELRTTLTHASQELPDLTRSLAREQPVYVSWRSDAPVAGTL